MGGTGTRTSYLQATAHFRKFTSGPTPPLCPFRPYSPGPLGRGWAQSQGGGARMLRSPAREGARSPTAPPPAAPTALALLLSSDHSDARGCARRLPRAHCPQGRRRSPRPLDATRHRPSPTPSPTAAAAGRRHQSPASHAPTESLTVVSLATACRRQLPPTHAVSGLASLRQGSATCSQPTTKDTAWQPPAEDTRCPPAPTDGALRGRRPPLPRKLRSLHPRSLHPRRRRLTAPHIASRRGALLLPPPAAAACRSKANGDS